MTSALNKTMFHFRASFLDKYFNQRRFGERELDYKTPTATIVTIVSNEIVAAIFFDKGSFLDFL